MVAIVQLANGNWQVETYLANVRTQYEFKTFTEVNTLITKTLGLL